MSKAHQGYYMVEEEAIRHLKKTFGAPPSYRKAVAAYHALLRVSNLKGTDTFEERIGALADDMGYGYNEAAAALKLVKLAGLCEIKVQLIPGSKEKGSSVYTVKRRLPDFRGTLPEKQSTSLGNRIRLPETPPALGFTESTQELPQELPNNHPKSEVAPAARFVPPTIEQAQAEAKRLGMRSDEGEFFFDYYQSKGWVVGKAPMKDWPAAMRTWKRKALNFRSTMPTRTKPVYEEKV